MNPPKGSVALYERRNGQWVEKNTRESSCRKSINEVLKFPVYQNDCVHKWISYNASTTLYCYKCTNCNKTTTSHIKIPMHECKHHFTSDIELGSEYEKYRACTKCGEQELIK